MPHSNNLCYEFGPYVLNMVQRVLTRSGETISITPKATDLLALFVENAGQLLEKEELLKEIWPDTFVEEGNVTQAIFQLRRALGDNRSSPKYIETVTRRGYRFISPVRLIDLETQKLKSQSALREPVGDNRRFPSCPVLAVMPFINSTDQESLEFLASGITDSIINSLSRLTKLRVMSRTSVLRFGEMGADPQSIGRELGVDAVLIGQICVRPVGLRIKTELVDVLTGWQLWGEVYDCEPKDVFQIQDEITTQLVTALRLALTGEERKRVTARYTENAEAYHAYLEGRHHWSRYTREGIEKAIGFFQRAIAIDPKYALAYAGIVDCYLRLTTGYLPPDDKNSKQELSTSPADLPNLSAQSSVLTSIPKIELRYQWDWKGAEREIRRANELKFDYPAAHQWHAAFSFCVALHTKSIIGRRHSEAAYLELDRDNGNTSMAMLTTNEQVQILCTIAREQIEAGNYEAGCLLLRKWWSTDQWPKLDGLNSYCAGDLLFTAGILSGCLSSTGRMPRGQKLAEALLSGSLGIFVHLGAVRAALESRIELALCYYRQGAFDLARETSLRALDELGPDEYELRGVALIRLAVLERHAGRLDDAVSRLSEAAQLLELCGPMATGRYYIEMASTLKNLRLGGGQTESFDDIIELFQRAFNDFEAVGHHRYGAVVQNNLAYLLLDLKRFAEAQVHLLYARRLFHEFDDQVRTAQVDDTLARLYLATQRFELAHQTSERAIATLEKNDEDALLAEALTTKGLVLCRLNRRGEAKTILEGAHRIADRCGDPEGAGRALLVIVEEMDDELNETERQELRIKLISLLKDSQQSITQERLICCLELLAG